MNKRIVTGSRRWSRYLDVPITVSTVIVGAVLMMLVWTAAHAAPAAAAPKSDMGFIVAAPDRGFMGNEEIREAFDAFAARHNAALVVVTDDRTRTMLTEALAAVRARGARRVTVLPLFLSPQEPRLIKLRDWAEKLTVPGVVSLPITFGKSFGESYIAVEALADRLHAVPNPSGRRVIVAGYGATSNENRQALETDWQRLAARAAEGVPFESVRALVWYDAPAAERATRAREMEAALAQAAEGGSNVVVVPFHLARRLDSMMNFTNGLKHGAPRGVDVAPEGALLSDALTWMEREANRVLPLTAKDTGIVVLAHGSDYHWNETIRNSVQALERRYPVEYCFSMADPPLIERAIRRLEKRGVRAIVVVRVFGLADSFQTDVERLVGLDVEESRGAHHANHDDHGHGSNSPVRRIRTPAIVRTVGGLDDHPLFARALLDRARALSKDPSRETVLLTAHGTNDDARNDRWLQMLESIAVRMRTESGGAFRDIKVITWREDWPDKRESWIAKARAIVEAANRDGGRTIVVPARTNAQGPERRYLDGLEFTLGSGFAPHPLFARWVEEQVKNGIATIHQGTHAATSSSNVARHHH